MGQSPQRRNERGIALVSVLWVLALLAVIAGSFTVGARTEAKLAHNLGENAKARALADAGIQRAVLVLLEPQTVGQFGEDGENMFDLGSRLDGTPHVWRFGGGEILISMQDEDGRIDLNTAVDELLAGLFVSLGADGGQANALVDAIADFRDANDFTRLNGAEDADYRAAGLDHGPKNAPFQAVEELQLVLGMTRDLYRLAAPALTVHSGRPDIDPATAPRVVLMALPGIDAAEVEALLDARADGDEAALAIMMADMVRFPGVGFRGLTADGATTLRAEARRAGGAVFVREAVARLGSDLSETVQFLAWRDGSATIEKDAP